MIQIGEELKRIESFPSFLGTPREGHVWPCLEAHGWKKADHVLCRRAPEGM